MENPVCSCSSSSSCPPNARALIPFFVFLVFYFGVSLAAGDFYKVPMPVAFLAASITALLLNRKVSLHSKVELFARGMGHVDIMTMCLIFILAGAFARTARDMGAVDATVRLAMHLVPPELLPLGLFLVGCFISLAMGTSVGTVLALAPIAVGMTGSLGLPPGYSLGAVVGGAMFGDNLSMISDTTIAATRTQNVEMHEKFYANLRIAIPASVLAMLLYLLIGGGTESAMVADAAPFEWRAVPLVLPYLAVLGMALAHCNVMAALVAGTLLAGAIGLGSGSFDFWKFLNAAGQGALSMSETLIVALLAGGLLKIIRYNGGIDYLLLLIEKPIRGRRGGELGIAALTAVVNVFTANNTVAIVITGPIAREISNRYGLRPARTAGILDTASCVVQGILPYGAQVLAAVGLAGMTVTPMEILQYLFYPYLLGLCLVLGILLQSGQRSTRECRK